MSSQRKQNQSSTLAVRVEFHSRGECFRDLAYCSVAGGLLACSGQLTFARTSYPRPTRVATDGWSGYGGLAAAGDRHEPVNLATSWGQASLRLPAIHLVFGLAKRWLLGTHHGAVSAKHLPAYLDEFVFRFNRRTANNLSHRFARVIQQAIRTRPITYHAIVAAAAT